MGKKRWYGTKARGTCKVSWEICNEIKSKYLNSQYFILKNGSYFTLVDCPSGLELAESSGYDLVKSIWVTNKDIAPISRPSRNPILFFHPNGYLKILCTLLNKVSNKSVKE